jgi:hypothetical protein
MNVVMVDVQCSMLFNVVVLLLLLQLLFLFVVRSTLMI